MGLADTAAQAAGPADDAGTFEKKDISSAIPPEQKDAVDRIVAAGMKIMYSPAMRDDLKTALASKDPTPKVLAENVLGLMLTMDQKAGKSGLPPPALLPAAVELLGDAADLMVKGGRPVGQDDYTTAIQMLFVMMSKKMGMNDAQIMDTANKALPPDQQVAGGAPPDGPAADAANAPPAGMPPAGAGGPAAPDSGAPGLAQQAAAAAPVDPNAPPPEEQQP